MKSTPFPDRCRLRGAAPGFTLVELLAVIGIVVILITLTVVGLRGINGTASRRSAVGTLMGVFDQARIVAISEGRATYVVFASAPRGQTQATTAITPTMWGRAYALFQDPVLQDSSNASNFYPVQRSAWLYLPTGVAFKCDGTDGTLASLTATVPVSGDTTQFRVMSKSGSSGVVPMSLPYVKFNATGEIVDYNGNLLDANSPSLRVLLFEGLANNIGVETLTRRKAVNATDGKKYAFDEILLKPTTGRARYTLDPSNNLAASN